MEKEVYMRDKIVYLVTVVLAIAYIALGHQWAARGEMGYRGEREDFIKARVVEIVNRTDRGTIIEGMGYQDGVSIQFMAKVLGGPLKGETVLALQATDPMAPVPVKEVEEGDKILLFRQENMPEDLGWIAGDYVRFDSLVALGVVFAVFLLIFGRVNGINTLVSLGFTCASVFLVFIPSILSGKNIYLSACATCVFIILMTLLIVTGANEKGLAAALGCFGGSALVGILTLIMSAVMGLTGLVSEESAFLYYLNPDNPIDLKGIIFGAIMVGAIGAIMDVAVAIAASLKEVQAQAPDIRFVQLTRSGFTIGRDVVGTMANTLVLAYIGSSLSIVLLLVAYNNSLLYLLNKEMIVVEILQSLVGVFGILFAIPFTSVVSSFLYTRGRAADPPTAAGQSLSSGEYR